MEVVMSFIQRYWDLFINLIRQFTFRDAIDVLVVSFIIYSASSWCGNPGQNSWSRACCW